MIKFYEQLREHVGSSRGLGIPTENDHQDRLALAAKFLCYGRAENVLDLGCGYGDLRMHILGCGYTGVDVHEWMIDEARRRLPVTKFKVAPIESLTPRPDEFDAVAALGVLVTVPPQELGAFMQRLASHGSRILVVSFIPADVGYTGVLYAHPVADVVGSFPVLAQGTAAGETTVMLDISRGGL